MKKDIKKAANHFHIFMGVNSSGSLRPCMLMHDHVSEDYHFAESEGSDGDGHTHLVVNKMTGETLGRSSGPRVNDMDDVAKVLLAAFGYEVEFEDDSVEGVSKVDKYLDELKDDIKISKADMKKNIVFGVVLEPDTVDAHNDVISCEEIEEAAHKFMKQSRVIGFQHLTKDDKIIKVDADVVQSFIMPEDTTFKGGPFGTSKVTKGSWVMGVEVKDKDLQKAINEKKVTGFSIGGIGRRSVEG